MEYILLKLYIKNAFTDIQYNMLRRNKKKVEKIVLNGFLF